MPMGKCPKCDKVLHYAIIEALPVREGLQREYKGASYQCQHCRAVLGIGLDPLAMRADIATAVKKALGMTFPLKPDHV